MGYLSDAGVVASPPTPVTPAAPPKFASGYLNSALSTPQNAEEDQRMLATQHAASDAAVAKVNADYNNSFSGMVKNTITGIPSAIKTVAGQAIAPGVQGFQEGVSGVTDMLAPTPEEQQHPLATGVADWAQLVKGVADTMFSPISGAFNIAQDVPGLKQLTDALNIPFTVAGAAASIGSGAIVDVLPIPDKSKAILKKPIQDLASLAAQVAVGGELFRRVGAVAKTGVDITPDVATRIVNSVLTGRRVARGSSYSSKTGWLMRDTGVTHTPSKGGFLDHALGGRTDPKPLNESKIPVTSENTEGTRVPLKTPNTIKPNPEPYKPITLPQASHADYARSQGYEPYTPDSELPTIQAGGRGPKASTTRTAGNLKIEPIKETSVSSVKSESKVQPIKSTPTAREVPAREVTLRTPQAEAPVATTPKEGGTFPTPVEGTGESRVPTLASKTEASAVARKLELSHTELPQYKSIKWEDQGQRAVKFLDESPSEAKAVAMGEKPAPEGVLPTAAYVAVENRATMEGDAQTIDDLAHSKITLQASAAGQFTGYLSQRDDLSPVKAVEDVRKARAKSITPQVRERARATSKSALDSALKKTASKRATWEELVNQITCGY